MLDLARSARVRLAVLAISAVALVAACTPLNSQEQYLFTATNQLRASSRVAPVYEYEPLTARARALSQSLAARGNLTHSNLRQLGVGWSVAAENIGRSHSVEDAFRMLQESPSHRANMLNGAYQYTGVGSARAKDGSVYVVQLFIRP